LNRILQKSLSTALIIPVLMMVGCGKKEEGEILPEGPPISTAPNFRGVDFTDTRHGISFRYYPEYKEIHRDEKGVILSKEGTKERIVVFVWDLHLNTYLWYVETFAQPLSLKRQLRKELKVLDEVISYRVLEKEGADAFLFTTRRKPLGLYNQRLELFPEEQPLQISFLFQHEKEDDPKVLDMIGSIKIITSSKE